MRSSASGRRCTGAGSPRGGCPRAMPMRTLCAVLRDQPEAGRPLPGSPLAQLLGRDAIGPANGGPPGRGSNGSSEPPSVSAPISEHRTEAGRPSSARPWRGWCGHRHGGSRCAAGAPGAGAAGRAVGFRRRNGVAPSALAAGQHRDRRSPARSRIFLILRMAVSRRRHVRIAGKAEWPDRTRS